MNVVIINSFFLECTVIINSFFLYLLGLIRVGINFYEKELVIINQTIEFK